MIVNPTTLQILYFGWFERRTVRDRGRRGCFTCLGIDAHEILVSAVTLDDCKRFYAEEIQFSANVRSPSLVAAFERVPREKFLGPGPWRIASAELAMGGVAYTTTDSADPHHVYHNVPIALDTSRDLTTASPVRWRAGLMRLI